MTKGMQKNRTKKHTRRGFSAIELLITATILSIVTGLGVMGISRAKASIRLSGAAREYASHIEKARMFSIRNHADNASERAGVAINADKTSYDVTVDLDGDGNMDTRTITLPDGVSFETIETIAFDWRGRTWNTVDGTTTPNAQVSIRLKNSVESISIDVTGSGDVTIDSRVFDDSVPNVNLNVGDLASGATPEPTPSAVATPTPDAGATPDPGTSPTESPTPDNTGTVSEPTPTPAATPTATPSATPAATPAATPRATPTPTPSTCTISTDRTTLALVLEGTGTIKVGHGSTTSLSISATSSKPSELQVTPGGSQTVGAGGSTTFTIKSKKSLGTYSVTFSSSCGSTTVPVVVAALSL
jgi:prepilin-type N-terminal cleavage/methylation domain-containing protein